jgi:hypothetical protein
MKYMVTQHSSVTIWPSGGMADTPHSKRGAERRRGSSPLLATEEDCVQTKDRE